MCLGLIYLIGGMDSLPRGDSGGGTGREPDMRERAGGSRAGAPRVGPPPLSHDGRIECVVLPLQECQRAPARYGAVGVRVKQGCGPPCDGAGPPAPDADVPNVPRRLRPEGRFHLQLRQRCTVAGCRVEEWHGHSFK